VGSGAIEFCSRKTSRLLSNWLGVGSIRPSTVIGEAEFIRSLTSIFNVTTLFVRCSCPPMVGQLASNASTGSNSTSRGSGS
jgi:hypothetical protein